jgi:hypothetical protein
MSLNLKRHLKILELLCCVEPKVFKILITKSSNNLILAICEIVKNLSEGNFKCKSKNFKKLKIHKKSIKQLARTSKNISNLSTQRKVLTQKGQGFLSLILFPFISEVAQHLIYKR